MGVRNGWQGPAVIDNQEAKPVLLACAEFLDSLGHDVLNVVVAGPHERPAMVRDFMRALKDREEVVLRVDFIWKLRHYVSTSLCTVVSMCAALSPFDRYIFIYFLVHQDMIENYHEKALYNNNHKYP